MQWQHAEASDFMQEDLSSHMQERQSMMAEGRIQELSLREAEAERNLVRAQLEGHSICKCGFSLNDV